MAMFDQPARRLRKKIDKDEDDQGRDELDAHRRTPLRLAPDEEEPIANELAASNAKCLQPTLNHDWIISAIGYKEEERGISAYPSGRDYELSHIQTAMTAP